MSRMASTFAAKVLQVKMVFRFFARLCLMILVIQLVVIFTYNSLFNPLWEATRNMYLNGMKMSWELCEQLKFSYAGKIFMNSLNGFLELQAFAIRRSFWVWLIFPMTIIYMILFDERDDEGREHIQGRQFIAPEKLNKLVHKFPKITFLKKSKLKKCISLGQIYLPVADEPKQTFVVGKPGVGKTNSFNYVIKKIRKRKQKAIIHDYKGDYVEKFYEPDRGDILFNPLDERSVGWCLFNDCKSVPDIAAFAAALIPEAIPGSEPFWNNAAREVFVGILHYCYANGKRTNRDIWETIILPNKDLYELLLGTSGGEVGAKHLADPDGRLAGSIMSNMLQYVKIFEYMSSIKGDFSITDWVTDKSQTGMIFLTNYAKLQNTLKPMISLFIQTVGSILLSEPDDIKNRVFLFLDEFGQLPHLDTITHLMTSSRSKGGSIFIGIQDIGQIDKIYKPDSRKSILNAASNRIVFNCKDYDTAKLLSEEIGETEYYENTSTKSLSMGTGDRVNTSRQRRKEYLVAPVDIQSLPDLSAFVNIGEHNVTMSKWKYLKLKKKSNAFIERPDLNLANLIDVNPDSQLDKLIKYEATLTNNTSNLATNSDAATIKAAVVGTDVIDNSNTPVNSESVMVV